MGRAVLSPLAEADLDAIWLYIARDSPAAADRFIDGVLRTCRTLADSPSMGRSRQELGHQLRSFSHRSYVIVYRPIRGGIEVARVVQGRRDIGALF